MLTNTQRAALTARLRRGRGTDASGIRRRDPSVTNLPLSFGQEQLWFIDRFAPGQAMYNIPLAIAVKGALDTSALTRAIGGLARRHEALRTRLVAADGRRPAQVIDPPGPVPLARADLSGGPRPAVRLRELVDSEAVRPFDLAAGPLARFSLIDLADGDHVLLVVVHHAIFDGWSAGLLLRDLAALYRQEAGGQPSGLGELAVQFADYALWERERLSNGTPDASARYWREAMAGFETVRFPADRPRPVVEDWAGGLAVRLCDRGLLTGLSDLSRAHGTTLFVTVMAGLQALLHRYTGQADLVVGTVSANRGRPELAPMIGFCVNTLPIRVTVSGDPSFSELIGQVKRVTTQAYAHQDLPFGKLVEVLRVERDPGRAPVFQIALAFAERDYVPLEAAGVTFEMTDLVAGIYAAKFDLSFTVEARRAGLWIECSYKTALFDHGTVARLLRHLEVLLRDAVADPAARLSRLAILTRNELRRELVTWNDTATASPLLCLHTGFEAQVRRTPSAAAARYEDERVSYAELDRQADQIAARLRRLGARPETLVGICMPSGLPRLAALLGVLKAGGGYVPLDPSLPAERLRYMIADARIRLIAADQASAACLPADAGAAVLLLPAPGDPAHPDPGPAGPGGTVADDPDALVRPDNVAYVIYTSGSTGRPKGVMIEHRQAVNFVYAMIGPWAVGPGSVVLQFAACTFDVSVLDIFVPLLAGGTVVLGHADTLHSPRRLAALIRECGVTFACLPPAVLRLLTGYEFPAMRTLLAAGEELPSDLAASWIRPGLRLVNAYGPTETAVIATYGEVTAQTVMPPPIGLPSANYRAYVLDAWLNPVPAGVTGELHIGGAGVARGYLSRPGLTAERFVADPFAPGGRLYKTGDLCRRRPDGAIVYLGRTDHQVKVRGLRIELGEIEAALTAHPAIAQAVAAVASGPGGDKKLVGYLRPEPGQQVPAATGLREYLSGVLPGYMIPEHIVTLDEFPLNSSGKIDRAALPPPAAGPGPATPDGPASEAEATLAGLFGVVLGRAPAGATESFFDIGGNSLQVMQLIDVIAEQLGADLSPAAVFLHPTPRQLAEHLSSTAPGSGQRPLLPLTTSQDLPPLILIHAIGGTVTDYTALAAELAAAYSPVGMQSPGLSGPGSRWDGQAAPRTLADLVASYLAIITESYPRGPYRLAGWSMGGVIGYEIARELEAGGASVGLLALLDAPFAVPADRTASEDLLAGRFLADVLASLGMDAGCPPDPAATPARRQIRWLAGRLSGQNGPPAAQQMATALGQRFEIFRRHTAMLAGYQPTPRVSAPALIVSAAGSPNAPAAARWPRVLSGRVSAAPVDGDHYSFLRPPAVTRVAASILAMA